MRDRNRVHYRSARVDKVDVFYRETGPASAPVLLLLHGYPTSSHMFRELIPRLSDRFRLIAPDLPGFGRTVAPPRGRWDYTFANLAQTVAGFTDVIGLTKYALYVFDYGAPTGFRLATMRPERVTAIITQNGNAYEEGLLETWNPVRAYWEDPTPGKRDALRVLLKPETTRWQYLHGVPDELQDTVSPDAIAHDQAILDREDSAEIQLDLFRDYRNNIALYPEWQAYLRTQRPPVLAVWGRNDPFFGPAGAEAFKRDVPDAEIHLLDTGHFALETHAAEIALLIRDFLDRKIVQIAQDAAAATRLAHVVGIPLSEDVVRQWPQSGELIRGRERIGEIESHFKGLRLGIGRRIAAEDAVVVEWTTDYGDGRLFRNMTIAEIEDGKAVRVTDYWGEPFDPPAWRASLTEPLAMPQGAWPSGAKLSDK